MSTESLPCKNDYAEEKRKLIYWIARWPIEEDCHEKFQFDVPELVVLLQAMGFRLDFLKKEQSACSDGDKDVIKIELTCTKSGMKGLLNSEMGCCKCPNDQKVNEGQFWSITACGPSSRNSITTSNSTLLPAISFTKTKVIRGLLTRVLDIINNCDAIENNPNLSSVKNISLLTRHRSLDTLKNRDDAAFVPQGLKRRPSWEVDPKTSPPTQTSSPLPDLCNSLKQVYLSSEKDATVTKNLEEIKKLVDETLDKIHICNTTFVKGIPKKRVSDIKLEGTPFSNDLARFSTSPKTSRSPTPRKILTPKKKLLSTLTVNQNHQKQKSVTPSRVGSFRDKMTRSPSMVNSVDKDALNSKAIPIRKTTGLSGSASNIAKLKTVSSGSKIGETGSSGIARLKNVGKITSNAITSVKRKL